MRSFCGWGRMSAGLLALTLSLSPWMNPEALRAHAAARPQKTLKSASAVRAPLPTPTQGVYTFHLPSGQTLYVKENRDLSVVTLDTWIKTGSANETDATNGVSHFLEHLLFKGADDLGAADINQRIESYGARFNAATSDDFTHYYISAPSRFLEPLLALHAAMLLRATIPPVELDRERQVVQEEINMDDDKPQRRLMTALSQMLFAGHGYAYDTLGTRDLIGAMPRARILNYYHHWYRPQNMNTVIVGDVSPQRAAALVQRYFPANGFPQTTAHAPEDGKPDPDAYAPPSPGKPAGPASIQTRVLEDPNVSQAYATLAFMGPPASDKKEVCALDAAMLALGSGRSSRLYQSLKERRNLVNAIDAGNWTLRDAGLVYVAAEVAPERLHEAQQAILAMVGELRARGITEEELNKAKTQTLKDFAFLNESTDGVANTLGYNVTIGELDDYTDYVRRIQQVSREDAQAAAARYLDFNRAVWAAVVPKGASALGTPATEEQRMRGLLAQAASGAKTVSGDKAPAALNATASAAVITRDVLPNGMTLIVKSKPEADTVAVKVMMRGGRSAEPIPGVAQLTAQLLQKGTQARDAETLNRELESRGMSLSASSAEDYLDVSGSSVGADLGELLLVMQDVIARPAFRAQDFAKEREDLAQSLKASRDEPSSLALETLGQALYPNHPYGDLGRRVEAHLPHIRLEDVTAYYQRTARPENMIVSVVGAVELDAIKASLLAAFPPTAVPASGSQKPPQAIVIPPVAPLTASQTAQESKPRQSATWIAQGWLAPSISEPDYAAIKTLNALLGTGMSSRLFRELREKQGLAYVVSSYYPSMREKSRLVMYIGADPKKRARVLEGFDREIARLQTTRPDAEELQQAKNKLTGAFLLDHASNASQAYYLALFELLGAGYDFDERYPQLIQQVSADDIQRAAQRLFSQPMVRVIVSPSSEPKPGEPGAGDVSQPAQPPASEVLDAKTQEPSPSPSQTPSSGSSDPAPDGERNAPAKP